MTQQQHNLPSTMTTAFFIGVYTISPLGPPAMPPPLELRKISHVAKNATLEKLPKLKTTKVVAVWF